MHSGRTRARARRARARRTRARARRARCRLSRRGAIEVFHLVGAYDRDAVAPDDFRDHLASHGHGDVVCVAKRRVDQQAHGLPVSASAPDAEHVVVRGEARERAVCEKRQRMLHVDGVVHDGRAVLVRRVPGKRAAGRAVAGRFAGHAVAAICPAGSGHPAAGRPVAAGDFAIAREAFHSRLVAEVERRDARHEHLDEARAPQPAFPEAAVAVVELEIRALVGGDLGDVALAAELRHETRALRRADRVQETAERAGGVVLALRLDELCKLEGAALVAHEADDCIHELGVRQRARLDGAGAGTPAGGGAPGSACGAGESKPDVHARVGVGDIGAELLVRGRMHAVVDDCRHAARLHCCAHAVEKPLVPRHVARVELQHRDAEALEVVEFLLECVVRFCAIGRIGRAEEQAGEDVVADVAAARLAGVRFAAARLAVTLLARAALRMDAQLETRRLPVPHLAFSAGEPVARTVALRVSPAIRNDEVVPDDAGRIGGVCDFVARCALGHLGGDCCVRGCARRCAARRCAARLRRAHVVDAFADAIDPCAQRDRRIGCIPHVDCKPHGRVRRDGAVRIAESAVARVMKSPHENLLS